MSKNEFNNNTSNHFKIRLPNLIRLEGRGWKVGLSGISLPDPKNTIPSWMKDDIVLLYMSWYREKKANSNQRGRQVANFILRDIKDHVDITQMNGVEFMKAVVAILQKKILSKNMDFTMNTASKDSNGNLSYFYPIFRFGGEDLLIDCTSVKFVEFSRGTAF